MMKALRYHGRGDLRLEDTEKPVCGDGQVMVKPAFVGICGTDLHEYIDGPIMIPTTPHPITGEKVPVTLGHEFSGVVEEIGAGVKHVEIGDRVVVQPIIYDDTCGACKDGFINCCEKLGFVGLSGWGGGLSDHVVIPREAVFRIPESVSMEVGALVEPLAVGWHAVNLSPFKKGESTLVLGGGPIGLAVVQSLHARGAGKIIVSEPAAKRRELAKLFGAHHVLDPTVEDIVAKVHDFCDGRGVNVAFDAAGVQTAVDQAILALRARGTLVNIAVWDKPVSVHPNLLTFSERNYMGVATFVRGDFQAVIDAIASGLISPKPMITRIIKMEEVEEKGFKALIEDKDSQVKILVEVSP